MRCEEAQPSRVHDYRPSGEATWRRTEAPSSPSRDAPANTMWNREKLSALNHAQMLDPQIINNNMFGCSLKPLSFGTVYYTAVDN